MSDEANPDKKILGTEVGLTDAMRFKGAAPEVINSRYALPPNYICWGYLKTFLSKDVPVLHLLVPS